MDKSPALSPVAEEAAAFEDKPSRAGPAAAYMDALKALNLGPVWNSALDFVRQHVAVANVRTLFACIGVGEATPFNVPAQKLVLPRLKVNANYFLTNYLIVIATVFVFLLLFFHPIQLIVLVFVVFAWYLMLTTKHQGIEQFNCLGKRIGEQELLLMTTAVTIIFLVFFILPEIMFALSTGSLGCAIHALLRNTRLKDDEQLPVTFKPVPADDNDEMV